MKQRDLHEIRSPKFTVLDETFAKSFIRITISNDEVYRGLLRLSVGKLMFSDVYSYRSVMIKANPQELFLTLL